MSHLVAPAADFTSYKKSLVDFLKSKPQFSDYDFEGSNLSVLIDLLAYNTFNNIHYQNMVGNEAWVDTAQLRQSLVSHATDLGYTPRSRISANVTISVEIVPNDIPTAITIPKNYRFRTIDPNGQTVYFLTNQSYTAVRDSNGRYLFNNIKLYEGTIVEEFFDISGVSTDANDITTYQDHYVLQSANIDTNSLEITVYPDNTLTNGVRYVRAPTLQNINETSLIFFLRGARENQYQVDFGDGVFGTALVNGNVVKASYRNTQGVTVQGNYQLSKTTDIQGYSDITISSTSRVQGGFERESIEEIRKYAPLFYQAQDRAVTDTDYEVLVRQGFPEIQQVNVYGGEEIAQYGKVIIVLKPFGTTGLVSDQTKSQIIAYLKTKNIVPEPVIVDPIYYYLKIDADVFYDTQLTSLTTAQIESNIINALVGLNNTDLNDFDVTVYQSVINDTITDSDSSIVGTEVDLSVIYDWQPGLSIPETLKLSLNNPIKQSLDGIYQNSNDWAIRSSVFSVLINSVETNVAIQDDGIGNLYLFVINIDGTRTKTTTSVGTVDYNTGEISIIVTAFDYDPSISIQIKTTDQTIDMIRDSFVIVQASNIDITMSQV